MVYGVRIHNYGDPGVLSFEEIDVGVPGAGEVLVRHEAIGLNYIDTYQRSGLYPLPALPAVLGLEAAGIVVACGGGVVELSEGDRVAYADQLGAYCQERV